MKTLNPSLFDDSIIKHIKDFIKNNKKDSLLLADSNTFNRIYPEIKTYIIRKSVKDKEILCSDIAKALFIFEILCVHVPDLKSLIEYETNKLISDFEIQCNSQ